jgi:hypothetical protein
MALTKVHSRMETGAASIAELKTYGTSMGDGDSVEVLGYTTAGDGGGGTFYWSAASTATDNGGTIIQATGVTTGRWIRVYSGAVNVKWFGATGDGTTDDNTAIQACLTAVSGNIVFGEGDTFITTLLLVVPNECNIDLNGSKIKFTSSVTQYNLNVASDNVTIRNGYVQSVVVGGTGAGNGIHNCPISVGEYGSGVGFKNINLTSLDIASDKVDGTALLIVGDSENVDINNIVFSDVASMVAALNIHWGGIDSIGTGSELTTHPHNIKVSNIVINTISTATGAGIALSGCYDVHVNNVELANITMYGLHIFCGDYGFEFATEANTKVHGFHNITVNNVTGTRVGYGLYIDGYKNVAPATAEKEVSRNIKISNCSFRGNAPTTSTKHGCRIRYIDDVTIEDCNFDNFYYGIANTLSSHYTTIKNNVIDNSYKEAIQDSYLNSTSTKSKYLTIEDNRISNSNQASSASTYDIVCSFSEGASIISNTFNSPLTASNVRGNTGANAPSDMEVINNTTKVATTSSVYSFGSSTDFTIVSLFSGNRMSAGVAVPAGGLSGGQLFLPYEYTPKAGSALNIRRVTGVATPTAGTWVIGDTVYYNAPSAGGTMGAVCTTGGTPGTWKTFGTIAS